MRVDGRLCKAVMGAVVLAGVGAGQGAVCQRGVVVPDAQVEAGVLKALAGASDLADQGISTTTVYGTVTLSGSVRTEGMRVEAEQLAAKAPGVKKVVDELTLSEVAQNGPAQTGVLQSDGTYAPADAAPQGGQEVPPPNGPNTDAYGRPLTGQQQGSLDPNGGQSAAQGGYGQNPMPPRGPYNGPYGPPPQRGDHQPYGNEGYGNQPNGQGGYGQVGGQEVTVPSGTLLQVRVNQHLNSRDVQAGTVFDAMVVKDIVAQGQIAIPRGAMVQGTVVDVERSGAISGRGELGLKLTQLTLAGRTYPISSDVFSAHGGDKTIQSVNSTLGLGALGAIFGAVAGGGAGAAIGAGVGGAVGLGSSAASGRGNVFIPSEAVLNFRLVSPETVTTVSQAEMQRLGYGVPAGGPQMVRRGPPPGYYYGPRYYPYPRYYYRPYGYYPY